MKKIISLFLALTMLISMVAFANDGNDILQNTSKLYEKEVAATAEAILEDGGNPDTSKAEFLYWIDPTYIKNNSFKDSISYMFVYIPDAETEDIYAADFNHKGLNALGKNFTFNGKLNLLYTDNALEDIPENAETVVNMCFGGRLAFLAYYVGTDKDNYIIVYDKFDDSKYNVTNVQELEIEFGKAYAEKDFAELIKKEAEAYADYLKEQREDKKEVTYRDENGDVQTSSKDKVSKKEQKKEDDDCDCDKPDCENEDCREDAREDDCDCDKPDCENEDCREDAREEEIEEDKKDSKNPEDKRKRKIKEVKDYGVFKGDENGNLNEDKYITRAEFAVVICNMLGIDAGKKELPDEMDFDDVPDKHWAKEYIKAARKAGFISGRGGNKFDPDAVVSYEEAMKMIVAAIGYTPKAEQKGGFPYGYTEVAKELGMMEDLDVEAKGKAIRGDIMEMVCNSLDIPFMLQKSFGKNVEYEIADGKNGNTKTLRILLEVPIPHK